MALTDTMRDGSSKIQSYIDVNPEMPDKLRDPLMQLIGKMEAIRACYDIFQKEGGTIPEISGDWQSTYKNFIASSDDAKAAKLEGPLNRLLEGVHAACEDCIATEPDVYIPRSDEIMDVMNMTFDVTWPWEEWEFEEKPLSKAG